MRTPRVPWSALRAGDVTLSADATRYLVRVLRLEEGDAFILFDPDARREARAKLVSAELDSNGCAHATVEEPREIVTIHREITVIYALAKGDKVDQVVRDATELGATRFIAVTTERAVVKLADARAEARRARWQKIAREAARQSGRADAPLIDGPLAWRDAIGGHAGTRILLHPRATIAVRDALRDAEDEESVAQSITIAIGPEGGFSDAEIAEAESEGFVIARIGDTVLRTETVVAAVLGAIAIEEG